MTPSLPAIDLPKTYGHTETRDDLRGIREQLTGKLLTLDETLKPMLSALRGLLEVPVTTSCCRL